MVCVASTADGRIFLGGAGERPACACSPPASWHPACQASPASNMLAFGACATAAWAVGGVRHTCWGGPASAKPEPSRLLCTRLCQMATSTSCSTRAAAAGATSAAKRCAGLPQPPCRVAPKRPVARCVCWAAPTCAPPWACAAAAQRPPCPPPACRCATPAACASCCRPSCHPSCLARLRVRRPAEHASAHSTAAVCDGAAGIHVRCQRGASAPAPRLVFAPPSPPRLPPPQPSWTSASTTSGTSCTRAARPACCR